MKDRFKRNKLWNVFPRNPIQTRYRRFVKMPNGEFKSLLTESRKGFKNVLKDIRKDIRKHFEV